MRRVIVVVLPVPAPARMQTGPRTASAARRCSGFRPARESTRRAYSRARRTPVSVLCRMRDGRLHRGLAADGRADRLRQPRDEPERVAVLDELVELEQL